MDEIVKPKRKLLTLKTETSAEAKQEIARDPTRFTLREQCFFMVFNEKGYLPKRVYRPDEAERALADAAKMAKQTGETFHVMRSWRVFQPYEVEKVETPTDFV